MADTGCQSCLADPSLMSSLHLSENELIPVSLVMHTASRTNLPILGAALLRIRVQLTGIETRHGLLQQHGNQTLPEPCNLRRPGADPKRVPLQHTDATSAGTRGNPRLAPGNTTPRPTYRGPADQTPLLGPPTRTPTPPTGNDQDRGPTQIPTPPTGTTPEPDSSGPQATAQTVWRSLARGDLQHTPPQLEGEDITLPVYIPGVRNHTSDALSRHPSGTCQPARLELQDDHHSSATTCLPVSSTPTSRVGDISTHSSPTTMTASPQHYAPQSRTPLSPGKTSRSPPRPTPTYGTYPMSLRMDHLTPDTTSRQESGTTSPLSTTYHRSTASSAGVSASSSPHNCGRHVSTPSTPPIKGPVE